MCKCKFCNNEYQRCDIHELFCKDNPNRKSRSGKNNPNYGKVGQNQFSKAKEQNIVLVSSLNGTKRPEFSHKHSDEMKQYLSEHRKKWLKENPDAHPWKKNSKFRSEPCELLKEKLRNAGLSFVEEYEPLNDRYFSIDIAFVDKKVGIEVNGNQHYNKDWTLRDYYKKRNDLIEQKGWKLIQVHYCKVYDNEFIEELIKMVL